MGSFSIWHWGIVLVIVILVFGTKKLKNMGSDLGASVKGFKDGMKHGGDPAADKVEASPGQVGSNSAAAKETFDVEAKQKS